VKPKKERSAAAKQSEGVAMRCKNKENRNANERLCVAALFVFAMHCDTLTFATWRGAVRRLRIAMLSEVANKNCRAAK